MNRTEILLMYTIQQYQPFISIIHVDKMPMSTQYLQYNIIVNYAHIWSNDNNYQTNNTLNITLYNSLNITLHTSLRV